MDFLGSKENYSFLAVPAYYLLAIVPHGFAIAQASNFNALRWNNANPRAESLKADLKKRLTPVQYGRYERAEAAHYNALESFPVFAAAVLIGNYVKLPVGDLNAFVAAMCTLRVLYMTVYIGTDSKGPVTYIRSLVWFAMVGLNIRLLRQAGYKAL